MQFEVAAHISDPPMPVSTCPHICPKPVLEALPANFVQIGENDIPAIDAGNLDKTLPPSIAGTMGNAPLKTNLARVEMLG